MIIRHKLFEKYENFEFKIDINQNDKVLIQKGCTIKKDSDLVLRKGNTMAYSFYLPEQLGCHISKLKEYITCIDGQLVEEGDTLAEKITRGGLSVNRLESPTTGVVDLSRIDNGYLDILGEDQEDMLRSSFSGEVIDVNPVEGLKIKSNAYALDLVAMSNYLDRNENQTISGEFVILSDGRTTSLKSDNSNYQGKIVFVGKHLHTDLLQDLFEKGAKFVLTCSMDYSDFRRQGLPIGIICGFGDIHTSNQMIAKIATMDKTYAVVDWSEKQIFFISDTNCENNVNLFVTSLIGNTVISRSLMNYGMLGKIVGVEKDYQYMTVEWENKGKSLIHIGSVEFVSI